MQQAGFEAIAFEQHAGLGGVWATTEYPSLAMHSKSFSYRFHDYPAMACRAENATGGEVREYFNAYAHAKQIADKIVFGRRVDRIVYRAGRDRRCLVLATDRAGRKSEHECDLVVCASGYI